MKLKLCALVIIQLFLTQAHAQASAPSAPFEVPYIPPSEKTKTKIVKSPSASTSAEKAALQSKAPAGGDALTPSEKSDIKSQAEQAQGTKPSPTAAKSFKKK